MKFEIEITQQDVDCALWWPLFSSMVLSVGAVIFGVLCFAIAMVHAIWFSYEAGYACKAPEFFWLSAKLIFGGLGCAAFSGYWWNQIELRYP